MDWFETVTAILVLYLVVVSAGHVSGLWKRVGATLYGPVLIWRTGRGIETIRRMARFARLWRHFARVGVALTLTMMVVLIAFLLWASSSNQELPLTDATLEEDGPALPSGSVVWAVVFAGLGMSAAALVHELGHGVVAVTNKLRLDSVGVLFVAIPVGAFVEPDDDDMGRAEPSTLVKVYAAGVAANILTALACLAVLTWAVAPAAEPMEEGVLVTAVAPDSPGSVFGVAAWSQVVAIGDDAVTNVSSFEDHWFDMPGGLISAAIRHGDNRHSVLLPQGIVIVEALDGPATNSGLKPGMIIQSLNDTLIHSRWELRSVVENSTHAAPVPITVLVRGQDPLLGDWFVRDENIVTVNLTSKWLWYYTHYNDLNKEEYKNLSFLGVEVAPFGLKVVGSEYLAGLYAHPYAGVEEPGDVLDSTVRLLSLPFIGYSPVLPPAAELYVTAGTADLIPGTAIWMLVNILYWVFWGNLMLGLANAMPALPFDGGYLFRNLLRWLMGYRRSRLRGIEKVTYQGRFTESGEALLAKFVTVALTVATLLLLAWLLLEPWV